MAPKIFSLGCVGSRAPIARSSRPRLASLQEDEEVIREDHPARNKRLAQAIQYLTTEDIYSSRQFQRRLDLIDRFILRRYPTEGLAFSQRLYNQVKAQVEKHKQQIRDLKHADRAATLSELIEETSESESSSIEESDRYLGLARDRETLRDSPTPSVPRAQIAKAPTAEKEMIRREPADRHDDVGERTKVWAAGAEPEIWHADMPALLPFGETVYMAEWESDWINADLNAGKERLKPTESGPAPSTPKGKGKERASSSASRRSSQIKEDGMVTTNVGPPKKKELHLYDSGSRFKLPPPTSEFEALKNILLIYNQGSKRRSSAVSKGSEDRSAKKQRTGAGPSVQRTTRNT